MHPPTSPPIRVRNAFVRSLRLSGQIFVDIISAVLASSAALSTWRHAGTGAAGQIEGWLPPTGGVPGRRRCRHRAPPGVLLSRPIRSSSAAPRAPLRRRCGRPPLLRPERPWPARRRDAAALRPRCDRRPTGAPGPRVRDEARARAVGGAAAGDRRDGAAAQPHGGGQAAACAAPGPVDVPVRVAGVLLGSSWRCESRALQCRLLPHAGVFARELLGKTS